MISKGAEEEAYLIPTNKNCLKTVDKNSRNLSENWPPTMIQKVW